MTKLDFSLVDRLSVPASLHDVDGRFLHMNASAESVLAKSIADMRGRRYTDPVPPEARESVERGRAARRAPPLDS